MPELLPGERPDKARYTLIVQPEDDVIPEAVRLRRLLKALSRRAGLRVLHIAERHEVFEVSPVDSPADK